MREEEVKADSVVAIEDSMLKGIVDKLDGAVPNCAE